MLDSEQYIFIYMQIHITQLGQLILHFPQFEQQSFPITGSENTEKQGQIDQAQETLEIKVRRACHFARPSLIFQNSISSSRTSTKAASALPRTSFEAFANSLLAIFLRESQY